MLAEAILQFTVKYSGEYNILWVFVFHLSDQPFYELVLEAYLHLILLQ